MTQTTSRCRQVWLPGVRRALGEPGERARTKILDHIDENRHRFIVHCPPVSE